MLIYGKNFDTERSIKINESAISFDGRLQCNFFRGGNISTSPIVSTSVRRDELCFVTQSGSHYYIVIEDKDELRSWFGGSLLLAAQFLPAFEPLMALK